MRNTEANSTQLSQSEKPAVNGRSKRSQCLHILTAIVKTIFYWSVT